MSESKNLHLHTFLCYTRLVMEEKIITIRSEEENQGIWQQTGRKGEAGHGDRIDR